MGIAASKAGHRAGLWALALATAAAAAFAFWPSAATGASVAPVHVDGNPTCADLGYAHGFKVDPPNGGTYNVGSLGSVTVSTDGVSFDWSSTFGIDAVISKGGSNANLYVYDPPAEALGDSALHSPINPNNGDPFGLSHIEFCYDIELQVSKTASTSYTRTYSWSIDKSVSPAALDMFSGDSGSVDYTVAATRSEADSDWAVSGQITITNPDPDNAATITGVSDVVSGAGAAAVSCGVSFPYQLAAGGTLVCSYSKALSDGSDRTNTATASTSGDIGGGSGTAAVQFGAPTTIAGHPAVTVADSNGSSWSFSGSGTVGYSRTFTCDADQGAHGNTATITETGQSDSASVQVNCYSLTVAKDARTSLTRTYQWRIEKSVDQPSLTLSPGQSHLVNYSVLVALTGHTDSNWAVAGQIVVSNPAPMAATLNAVSDIVSGAGAASVDCGVTFPYSLAAGGSLTCSYTSSLPDAADRTNTATATLQNHPAGTTDFSGTAAVSFAGAAVQLVDDNVAVNDSFAGFLGNVNISQAPKTFAYSRMIGPYEVCGQYTVDNTATFTTDDLGAGGSASATVSVLVPCAGCTLTPGYWKTHSDRGPAPYDVAWKNLGPLEEDTPFFTSGKTYYAVLWTAPQGDAYYILAHAFIAAQLNVLDGADDSAVASVIAAAGNWLATDGVVSKGAERNQVLAWAAALDAYNNGLTGPGHCTQ